jgi:hypothetical protein
LTDLVLALAEQIANVDIAEFSSIGASTPGIIGGNTYNIQVDAGGILEDPRRVGQAIIEAIKRYERSSGQVFASA